MNVEAATPGQLVAAIAEGKLTDLGMPPPRVGRQHDPHEPPVSPVARILTEQAAQAAVAEKARTAPSTLTTDDIAALDSRTVSALVYSGALAHLGVGQKRARR
jgi:hypothetical protein